jgi:hypothetical protein
MISVNAWQPNGALKSAPAPLIAPSEPQVFTSRLRDGPPLPLGAPPVAQLQAVRQMNECYGDMQCYLIAMLDSGAADDATAIDAGCA